jgi:type IV secretory pathway TraG/TraD family ATPase VirD4
VFLANDIMRPIVAQQESAFDFRQIMDTKKIFLANLSKGRLGDRNAQLLGLVLVSKFLAAAFSRIDTRGELPPFYLYIDEFQNFATPSIATILSEARKYRLSLTIAHQFIAQLEEDIRDAVIGNVGTKIAMRIGTTDAEFLEKQFAPVFTAHDLENLPNYNAILSLLVNGGPEPPSRS